MSGPTRPQSFPWQPPCYFPLPALRSHRLFPATVSPASRKHLPSQLFPLLRDALPPHPQHSAWVPTCTRPEGGCWGQASSLSAPPVGPSCVPLPAACSPPPGSWSDTLDGDTNRHTSSEPPSVPSAGRSHVEKKSNYCHMGGRTSKGVPRPTLMADFCVTSHNQKAQSSRVS